MRSYLYTQDWMLVYPIWITEQNNQQDQIVRHSRMSIITQLSPEERKQMKNVRHSGNLTVIQSRFSRHLDLFSRHDAFELSDGRLQQHRGQMCVRSANIEDVTVRANGLDLEIEFNGESVITTRAKTSADVTEWVTHITRAQQLKRQMLEQRQPDTERQIQVQILIKRLQEQNRNILCCDCQGDEPVWVALDKGITLCASCAEVHRELDCSRIRSCWDLFPEHFVAIVLALGNTFCNSILENRLLVPVLSSNSSLEERTSFIKAKYVDKTFALQHELTSAQLREELISAIQGNDLRHLFYCFSQGAQVNGYLYTDTLFQPLHVAALMGTTLSCVFLLLNGASVDALDIEVDWLFRCH
eukprot:c4073_g1_i2.p1 GENE.c4073_g1_i2~~c4073_g1_i2.p1  ORF type:complete len:357 (-),score=30.32 c4073_g1_i2:558-1628(-)